MNGTYAFAKKQYIFYFALHFSRRSEQYDADLAYHPFPDGLHHPEP